MKKERKPIPTESSECNRREHKWHFKLETGFILDKKSKNKNTQYDLFGHSLYIITTLNKSREHNETAHKARQFGF